jgi:uncharacterized protein
MLLLTTLVLGFGLVVPGSDGTHADVSNTEKQQDFVTALRVIKPLAEEGDAFAQLATGIMYFNGWDTPRDYVQARMWFNLASFRTPSGPDQETASLGRDLAGARMTPEQIDKAQKLTQEWFFDLERRTAANREVKTADQ